MYRAFVVPTCLYLHVLTIFIYMYVINIYFANIEHNKVTSNINK